MNDVSSKIMNLVDTYSAKSLLLESLTVADNVIYVAGNRVEVNGKLHMLAIGKPALSFAEGFNEIFSSSSIQRGKSLCFTKHHHAFEIENFECYEGGHPIPDEHSFLNGKVLLETVETFKEDDVLLVGVSGGGSAIIELPHDGFTKEFISSLNDQLVASGAPIQEVNLIRSQVSAFKNGGLTTSIKCNNIIVLCLSDVPSGSFREVSSNPFTFEETSTELILKLASTHLTGDVGDLYQSFLGSQSYSESVKKRSQENYARVFAQVIGSANNFLEKIALKIASGARQSKAPLSLSFKKGLDFTIDEFLQDPKTPLVSGGEFPVTVKGSGKGGRNTHYVLAAALELEKRGVDKFFICSVGTDGDDGFSEGAGAYISKPLLQKAREDGLLPENYLEQQDSATFFNEIKTLIPFKLTGTNVMDMRIIASENDLWEKK